MWACCRFGDQAISYTGVLWPLIGVSGSLDTVIYDDPGVSGRMWNDSTYVYISSNMNQYTFNLEEYNGD